MDTERGVLLQISQLLNLKGFCVELVEFVFQVIHIQSIKDHCLLPLFYAIGISICPW